MTTPAGTPASAGPGAAPSSALATLFPGYFAFVMATGIVAVGAEQQGIAWLAEVLFALAVAGYAVLVGLTVARVVRYPRLVLADLTSHLRGFAFLTTVAASNVLGSGAAVIHQWWGLAWAMWVVGLALWVVLVYPAVLGVMFRDPKPDLGLGINASWFLLTVATESVVVLGALLLARTGPNQAMELVTLAAFNLGVVLYLIVMTMLFLRWTFQPLSPAELDPPAWIAAGAVAITVLAGSNLLAARTQSPRVERLAPYVEGVVVLAWGTATFWFPVMIAVGVWRHVVRHVPLRYVPGFWALVFPIGMYGAATFRMIGVTALDGLDLVPKLTLAVAVAAWSATFGGLLWSLGPGKSRA